jgi:hypothetical protein
MFQISTPSRPQPSTNDLSALKMVKHGIPIADEMRRRLLEERLIMRERGGWALTDKGARLEAMA